MLVRHGTRYPGTKKIKKMDEVLSKLKNKIILQYDKGSLCDKELKLFEKWKLYPKLIDHKNLAHEGEDEMIDLAERMQNRFPNLFPQEYDNNTYYVSLDGHSKIALYLWRSIFSLDIQQHKDALKVQDILLLDYLVEKKAEMFGFLIRLAEIPF